MLLIKLARKRNIKITVRAGDGGWATGIWRDNFNCFRKAIKDVSFHQEMFPDLPLLAEFEATDFSITFGGHIVAVPHIDIAALCDRKLSRQSRIDSVGSCPGNMNSCTTA